MTAVEHFNNCIQQAAWQATPVPTSSEQIIICLRNVLEMLSKERALRKQWQKTRYPPLKTKLNKELKKVTRYEEK